MCSLVDVALELLCGGVNKPVAERRSVCAPSAGVQPVGQGAGLCGESPGGRCQE